MQDIGDQTRDTETQDPRIQDKEGPRVVQTLEFSCLSRFPSAFSPTRATLASFNSLSLLLVVEMAGVLLWEVD